MRKRMAKLTGDRLLKAAINHILLHPETWDQSTWHSSCKTKHCIAGTCQILAGFAPDSLGAPITSVKTPISSMTRRVLIVMASIKMALTRMALTRRAMAGMALTRMAMVGMALTGLVLTGMAMARMALTGMSMTGRAITWRAVTGTALTGMAMAWTDTTAVVLIALVTTALVLTALALTAVAVGGMENVFLFLCFEYHRNHCVTLFPHRQRTRGCGERARLQLSSRGRTGGMAAAGGMD